LASQNSAELPEAALGAVLAVETTEAGTRLRLHVRRRDGSAPFEADYSERLPAPATVYEGAEDIFVKLAPDGRTVLAVGVPGIAHEPLEVLSTTPADQASRAIDLAFELQGAQGQPVPAWAATGTKLYARTMVGAMTRFVRLLAHLAMPRWHPAMRAIDGLTYRGWIRTTGVLMAEELPQELWDERARELGVDPPNGFRAAYERWAERAYGDARLTRRWALDLQHEMSSG